MPLRIETGRYIGQPLDERLCKFCSIENESHFLLECQHYNDIRSKIFGDIILTDNFIVRNKKDKLPHLVNRCPREMAK